MGDGRLVALILCMCVYVYVCMYVCTHFMYICAVNVQHIGCRTVSYLNLLSVYDSKCLDYVENDVYLLFSNHSLS